MPELPEVETVRLGLNRVTLAQPLQGGEVLLDRTIAYPASSAEFLAGLQGRVIANWHRRGKYLLAELVEVSPNPTDSAVSTAYLGVHLRMTGQFLWVDRSEPIDKHTRVRFSFPLQKELRFLDQRTFGQMWWVPPGRSPESIITGLQHLGPEPLSGDFSLAYFAAQLKRRQRPIKNALLDQALVAGIGNIYADESLFMSGIHPETLCTDLHHRAIERLHRNIIQVLETSIAAKGTTFSSFRNVEGVNGNYGGMALVYGRLGAPCKTCDTAIERIRLAGRSAHFCPKCQPPSQPHQKDGRISRGSRYRVAEQTQP